MALEPIRHPSLFFAKVRKLLNPHGRVCLFFASVTNFPMLVNKLLPDSLSHKVVLLFQPFRKNEKHGKFRAYYRWCFGPTRGNIKRFEKAGFRVETYTGVFGHSYYQRIPVLQRLEKSKTAFLLKHPTPYLCTYGQMVLSREGDTLIQQGIEKISSAGVDRLNIQRYLKLK